MGNKPFARIDLTPLVGVLLALFAITLVDARPSEGETRQGDQYPTHCFHSCDASKATVIRLDADGGVFLNGVARPGLPTVEELKRIQARAGGAIFVSAGPDESYGRAHAAYQLVAKVRPADPVWILDEDRDAAEN